MPILKFHCGAEMTVKEAPLLEVASLDLDIKKSDVRNDYLRIRTWTSNHSCLRPHFSDNWPSEMRGKLAPCLACPCRRAAGRQAREYFPTDYAQEKEGKYKGKRFLEFAVRAIACFAKEIEP